MTTTDTLTLRDLRDRCKLVRCARDGCPTAARTGSSLCWDHHRDAHRTALGHQDTAWCCLTDTRALVLL